MFRVNRRPNLAPEKNVLIIKKSQCYFVKMKKKFGLLKSEGLDLFIMLVTGNLILQIMKCPKYLLNGLTTRLAYKQILSFVSYYWERFARGL